MIIYRHMCFILRKNCLKNTKCRYYHYTSLAPRNDDVNRIRNIGILAHIDAGKTTTTERMLYYSGRINYMGEVHDGNTVTDYLEQERERGITISSASVTIPWLKHHINIIDTPGHIDFTFEVEQSLNVIDGAIIILDGSAGVEPQTVTVWRQANKYNVPRIVYVNKMDRMDANLDMCLRSLKSKFDSEFLALQVPIAGKKIGITAIIDIISKDILTWSGEQGEVVNRTQISENDEIYPEVKKRRIKLVDKLADLDDALTEEVLREDSLDKIGIVPIYDALKRVTLAQKAVPVLCGSSYKNIGVQKLLDAVIEILPSPNMREDLRKYDHFNNHLSAKAFKVVHDKQKGPITFFRIYSGTMTKSQKLFNVNKDQSEQLQRLMIALADDYEEVSEITAGNIAAATGLKSVFSGDLVTSSQSVMKNATIALAKRERIDEEESRNRLCPKLHIPEPVFFCSIEAPSQAYQVALDTALDQLQREDPSLHVKIDSNTGQTVLGGMGELHLEIIKDRILKKYKVDADLGPLQIAYKEYLTTSAKDTHFFEVSLGDSKHYVKIILTVYPKRDDTDKLLTLDKSSENVANTTSINPRRLNLLEKGIETALSRGPKVGCPVANARCIVHWLEVKRGTSDSIITSTTTQIVQKLLKKTQSALMEPVMNLEVITDERNMKIVMSDLSRRRADIIEFLSRGDYRIVRAKAPLSELMGYSKDIRVATSGNANFSIEFDCYREVSGVAEQNAIKDITGFYPT